MSDLEQKTEALRSRLEELGSLIVAFSGGIDSALLLKVAADVLGENALAVTADSASVPRSEMAEARTFAEEAGARHLVIKTDEFENPDYVKNPANRCYYCKAELYTKLQDVARQEGIRYIANGANVDDQGDYRPGHQAAAEYEVVSPLMEAGFTKADIRALAKELDLEIWDKPASPCLSSRIPYGSIVTAAKLSSVEKAEDYLHKLGIREVRVRHFEDKARIDAHPDDFPVIEGNLEGLLNRFRELGFEEIELKEFRSGALNDALKLG